MNGLRGGRETGKNLGSEKEMKCNEMQPDKRQMKERSKEKKNEKSLQMMAVENHLRWNPWFLAGGGEGKENPRKTFFYSHTSIPFSFFV